MANILESLLTNLMHPDNASFPQVHHFIAVILRRRFSKCWRAMPVEQRQSVKTLLLEAIQREPEHKVRHALAQLCAVVLRNEKLERWPQFIRFVLQTSYSEVPEQRQVGLLVLSCALDLSAEIFHPHFTALIHLFHNTLCDLQNGPLLFYTIQSLTSIVPEFVGNKTKKLRPLIPKLVTVIKQLIQINEVQACKAMEVFEELMEREVSVFVYYLAEFIHFCIEIAVNISLSDDLRVKALYYIRYLIKRKSKSILKQKLLPQILNAVFPIMCAEPPPGQLDPEDEDELLEYKAKVKLPKHHAFQVIYILGLRLPSEKLFSQLTPLMEPCLLSKNPYERKAGLMCIGVLSEGCADHIQDKHLKSMRQLVCQAISDESHVVRNAALFACLNFSEHLQLDFSSYADSLLLLLLDPSKWSRLAMGYFIHGNFVAKLGSRIEPYLPTLMERILGSMSSSSSSKLKELLISALKAIGEEEISLPFISPFCCLLKFTCSDNK